MAKAKIRSGQVLLAEPFMLDPNFKRSAVLLCEHGPEGSIGFIFNKRLDMRVDSLINDFPEFNSRVFFGGPVQTDTIHYLHNVGDLLEGSIQVAEGVWWGGDFQKLKFLIDSQLVLPKNIRFFVGYSGWSEGQLESELEWGSWVMADMDPNYLFKSRPEQLWSQIMRNKGSTYTVIAQMPDAVTWN
ncbi:MAG: YqgE/AlgH family protein [Bacteroidetes bacterium]|nr:MAG: YqgE/AlgH family protein [Bacteroidota bacterium]